mgnify:CR=1 FL=1
MKTRTKAINITFGDDKLLTQLDQILDIQKTSRSRFFRLAARNYIEENSFLLGIK